MKINYFIILIITMLFSQFAYAQLDTELSSKFITFKKARFSPGLNVGLGYASFSPKPDEHSGGLMLNYGVHFDLLSPLSATGFNIGINYKMVEHNFYDKIDEEFLGDSIDIHWVEIPFFVRFRTGSVTKIHRFVFMPGISYNIPLRASMGSDFTSSYINDPDMIKPYLDYKIQMGWEFLIGLDRLQESGGTTIADGPGRILVYLGVSYSNTPIYDDSYSPQLPSYYAANFNDVSTANSLNYYGGFSFYYSLGWKHIGAGR